MADTEVRGGSTEEPAEEFEAGAEANEVFEADAEANEAQTHVEDEVPSAAQMRHVEEERDMYKDALIRERADFENYKKRNATLAASSFESGVESVVQIVLPILDNFERGLASECSDQGFADGMQMIMRQLQSALTGLGVTEIETEGAFDPEVHHAVMQTEDPALGPNEIAETLQKGYMRGGKVLRPAMVKVNK